MGEQIASRGTRADCASSGQDAGDLVDAVIPGNHIGRNIKVCVITRLNAARPGLAGGSDIGRGSAVYSVGVASGKTPTSYSDGVIASPGGWWVGIVAIIEIIEEIW